MAEPVFDKVRYILRQLDESEARKVAAQRTLDEEYAKALRQLEQNKWDASRAVSAANAAVQSALNARLSKADREYERVIRSREKEANSKLSTIRQLRAKLNALERRLPGSLIGVEAMTMAAPELFGTELYEELLTKMNDTSLLSSAKRLFGDGSLSPSQAAAQYKGMIDHDRAVLDGWEREARKLHDTSDAKARLASEKESIERERASMKPEVFDERAFERQKAELAARYKAECRRLSSSSGEMSLETGTAECRELSASASDRLLCSPNKLRAPYEPPSLPSIEMFDYWMVIEAYGQGFVAPHSFDMSKPTHYAFESYQDSKFATGAMRSMLAFQIKNMPVGGFRAYWLDPVSMGRTLGRLIALASPLSCGADSIISVATSPSEVYEALHGIETSLGEVSLKVAAFDSLWNYNTCNPDNPIPQTVVVVNGIESQYYDTRDINILNMLADNSSALGIQLLLNVRAAEGMSDEKRAAIETLVAKCSKVKAGSGQHFVEVDSSRIPVLFAGESWITDRFLDDVKHYAERHRADSSRASIEIDTDGEGLSLPVATSEQGDSVILRFGLDYAHAIITGAPGSGKSVFLHNVIESACTHYTSRQLNVWLVDYKKTEFGIYRDSAYRFPQISFLGLDGSEDFVNGFVRLLTLELKKRQNALLDDNSKDIRTYNLRHPDDPMPKLLIVIDEFHRQSEQMEQNEEAKASFEQILRESRAFGIYVLLSDQALSGMRGLSMAARNQIAGRIMLKWAEVSELAEMFGASGSMPNVTLDRGEALYRLNGEIVKCKGRFIDADMIEQSVKNLAPEFFEGRPEFKCYDASQREEIELSDARLGLGESRLFDMSLPVGTIPDFGDPIFSIDLNRRRKENIFVFATEPVPAAAAVAMLAAGMVKKRDAELVVVADRSDFLFQKVEGVLSPILALSNKSRVLDSVTEIGEYFSKEHSNSLVILIDFDAVAERMEGLPAQKTDDGDVPTPIDDGSARLAALIGKTACFDPSSAFGSSGTGDGVETDSRGLVLNAIKTGGTRGVHFCWMSSDIPTPRVTFQQYAEYGDDFDSMFAHRFATRCGRMDSINLGMSTRAHEIKDDEHEMKIVYGNRAEQTATLKPFSIKTSS